MDRRNSNDPLQYVRPPLDYSEQRPESPIVKLARWATPDRGDLVIAVICVAGVAWEIWEIMEAVLWAH